MRNEFAEYVSNMIMSMCRYSKYGCREQVIHDQRSQHEDICPFLPVECLAGKGEKEVSKCGWRNKKSELLEHVCSVHGSEMIRLGQVIEGIWSGGFDRTSVKVILVCALGDLFWLTVKNDIESNTRLEAVQYVGSERKAEQFEYKHELTSLDGKTSTSFLRPARNCFEDISAVLDSNLCFHTDINFFKNLFVYFNKYVPGYKLTIQKTQN
jgi:hypothetical protein